MVVLRSSDGLVLRGKPGGEWEGLTHKQAGQFPDANVKAPLFAGLLCCAEGGTRTHTPRREPDFESDKVCGMVRDAASTSAFISLFATIRGMVRVDV